MPFNPDAVEELRRREHNREYLANRRSISFNGLCNLMNDTFKEKNLKFRINRGTLYRWVDGSSPNAYYLDILYKYAEIRGYTDIEFYLKPEIEVKI